MDLEFYKKQALDAEKQVEKLLKRLEVLEKKFVEKYGSTQTQEREKFYLTTAINYTNGNPHMGHAYEAITSDVIARYHRIFGRDVFFLTGTDEHGQKIANTAEKMGKKPIDLCNMYVEKFKELNKRMNISNEYFIRTTEPKHLETAQTVWRRSLEAGDIYLGTYSGWYNVREETFVTENEASMTNYKDPGSGVDLVKMEEASYFFKMSKYQDKLIAHIKSHPEFIQPEPRRNEILLRLKEPLLDLSISRTTFDWGVPVPNDPKHVMYVWFDALTNYLSGIDFPNGSNAHFWPANVQIIGKDIVWFHTVIWPCMLMSANIPLPKTVFSHGFVNAPDGRKMSKSLGNVVDPNEMLEKYPVDTFRFFLVRETTYGYDLSFSEDVLIERHNSELADTLGNLVHRAVNLTKKYCGGKIPDVPPEVPFDLKSLIDETETAYNKYALSQACELAMSALRDANKYITEKEPWHMKENQARERQIVVRTTVESIYILAHFLSPYLPSATEKIFKKLNTPPKTIQQLSPNFCNLKVGTKITVGDILFQKLEYRNKEKEKQAEPKEVFPLDIRGGLVEEVNDHPTDSNLFLLTVNVGEKKAVVARLKAHYSEQQLKNRKVVVLCNLPPAEIKGAKSEGMMLVCEHKKSKKTQLLQSSSDADNWVGCKIIAKDLKTDPKTDLTLKEFQKLDLKLNKEGKVIYNSKYPLVVENQEKIEITGGGMEGPAKVK